MSLIVKNKASNIPTLEAGVYTAICVGIVDLGEQKSERFGKYQERVTLFFEICGEYVDVGEGELKSRWLSKEFTASLNERSNLRKTIQSWRNKELTPEEAKVFDLTCLLGAACQVQVMQNQKDDRTYNTIDAIIGLPKGVEVKDPVSELFMFDMDDLPHAEEILTTLPAWVQDKINNSPTWGKLHQNTEEIDIDEAEADTPDTPTEQPTMEVPF